MAQTKRKRRTKHRGNAAGIVETRGRTGRKADDAGGGRPKTRDDARQRRLDRMNRPPTWRAAVNRAVISTVVFAALVLLLFDDQTAASVAALAAFMLIIYIPAGYYMDKFIYERRQRSRARAAGKER